MPVILAPIDGSARALRAVPWAARFAGPGGTVVLLRAIPPQPEYAAALLSLTGGGEDGVQRVQDEWNALVQEEMDEAEQMIAGSGVTVERLIAEGEPDEVIVAAIARRGADMIAMASHGRGAIGRAIFGSVADRVARASTVPVLILRTPEDAVVEDAPVRRIVVPLDGSELAAEALPVAVTASRSLAAPVHVVRAVDAVASLPMARGTFAPTPTISMEVADRLLQEMETEARQTITDAVAWLQAEGVEATSAVLSGSPFFAITETTEPDDLLVLTSHGRGGVRRWLLGSVAEKLVREAPAPVLLVPSSSRAIVGRES